MPCKVAFIGSGCQEPVILGGRYSAFLRQENVIGIYCWVTNDPQIQQLETRNIYDLTQFLWVRYFGAAQSGGSGSGSLQRQQSSCEQSPQGLTRLEGSLRGSSLPGLLAGGPGPHHAGCSTGGWCVLTPGPPQTEHAEGRLEATAPFVTWPVLVARAATTERHRLGGLHSRNVFFHSSGGWKAKIKVSASGFLLRPLSVAAGGHVSLRAAVVVPSSCKDAHPMD